MSGRVHARVCTYRCARFTASERNVNYRRLETENGTNARSKHSNRRSLKLKYKLRSTVNAKGWGKKCEEKKRLGSRDLDTGDSTRF